MEFTRREKNELLEYVAQNLKNEINISIEESRRIVQDSIIVDKIKTSPGFVAHCSVGQLVDMVKSEKKLMYA